MTQKHILQAVFGDNRVVWVASFRPICINLQFLADPPTSPSEYLDDDDDDGDNAD